ASEFGLQAFLCDLLVPCALFRHFRSDLTLLNLEILEQMNQGIEQNRKCNVPILSSSCTSELSGTHATLLTSSSAGHELMRRLTTHSPTLLGTSPNMVFYLHQSVYKSTRMKPRQSGQKHT
ncbi:hypothetical protein PIB30_066353, partial [Stylosanthes scabra]|nr:hypothetical protein [Stylosanthes scabra]